MSRGLLISMLLLGVGALGWGIYNRLGDYRPPISLEPEGRVDTASGSVSIPVKENLPKRETTPTRSQAVFALASKPNDFDNLSSAVFRVVVPDDSVGLAERSAALSALSRFLSPDDRDALYAFLLDKDRVPHLNSVQRRVLVNDVMKTLRLQQDDTLALSEVFSAVYADQAEDVVIRDYALQHLGSWLERPVYDEAGVFVLWQAVQERESTLAGTAILSLMRVARVHPYVDLAAVADAAERMAGDPRIATASRITALSLSAELGGTGVLSTARGIARDSRIVGLQAAAVSLVGKLGNRNDLPLLLAMVEDETILCKPAVREAIQRLQRL
ncbi:MAG TPA: hypothetical protein PJ991_09345 [Kiritimatiellia bacterium]|nr:hypothetical protein [Kiritimatiellia bacterium]